MRPASGGECPSLVATVLIKKRNSINFLLDKPHFRVIMIPAWGYSSAGRALEWHSRGQRFDPAYLHQSAKRRTRVFQKPVRTRQENRGQVKACPLFSYTAERRSLPIREGAAVLRCPPLRGLECRPGIPMDKETKRRCIYEHWTVFPALVR